MFEAVATKTKRILIVDDERAVVQALSLRCEHLGLGVFKAYNAVEAMKVLNNEEPPADLVLLDLAMPGADGLTFCDMIRTDTTLAPVPVILLTGSEDNETRRRCEQVGAHYVHKDVSAWEVLQPLICKILELQGPPNSPNSPESAAVASAPTDGGESPAEEDTRKTILIIDDDPAISKVLKVRFEAAGYRVRAAYAGMQGYWMALKNVPDLILLDYKLPDGWGNRVLGKLKSNSLTSAVPVFILSGMTDLGVQRDIIRLGAEQWINKPFDIKELLEVLETAIG